MIVTPRNDRVGQVPVNIQGIGAFLPETSKFEIAKLLGC
jgi:hypothetical protein